MGWLFTVCIVLTAYLVCVCSHVWLHGLIILCVVTWLSWWFDCLVCVFICLIWGFDWLIWLLILSIVLFAVLFAWYWKSMIVVDWFLNMLTKNEYSRINSTWTALFTNICIPCLENKQINSTQDQEIQNKQYIYQGTTVTLFLVTLNHVLVGVVVEFVLVVVVVAVLLVVVVVFVVAVLLVVVVVVVMLDQSQWHLPMGSSLTV